MLDAYVVGLVGCFLEKSRTRGDLNSLVNLENIWVKWVKCGGIVYNCTGENNVESSCTSGGHSHMGLIFSVKATSPSKA